MGVVTGSILVETSEEEVAYSEDPDVVTGEARAGCGWCPVHELERATPQDGADVLTVRNLNDKERTRFRDIHTRIGPASANAYAGKTAVVAAQVRDAATKKVKRLTGALLQRYLDVMAQRQPHALDLLADRIIHRTDGHGTVEPWFYDACRRLLGYEPVGAQPAVEEGDRDDGDPKSESAAS